MTRKLLILLLTAFILRLLLMPFFTYYSDLLLYKSWGVNLAQFGPLNFYGRLWSDYLPGYLYMLMFVSFFHGLFASTNILIPDEYTYKFIPVMADIVSGFFVYKILNTFATPNKSLLGTTIFLFSISTLALSSLWGQSDGVVTVFLISSLYFLISKKVATSFALLGLAQITKPIAIISIPIYLVWLWQGSKSIPKIIFGLVIYLLAILIPFIGFTYNDYNIFQTVILRHIATFDQYQYTSLNSFSFWGGLHGFWISDQLTYLGLNYRAWGYFLYAIPLLIIILNLCMTTQRYAKTLIASQAINYMAMFIFITRMHERHMYYGLTLGLIFFLSASRLSKVLIVMSVLVFAVNLFYAYSINAKIQFYLEPSTLALLCFINFATMLCLIRDLLIQSHHDHPD